MEFVEVREKGGLLYPLFEQKELGANDSEAEAVIISSYSVEISKEFEYKAVEIIYSYK